jgi:predicted amidohydrolase YtcJ
VTLALENGRIWTGDGFARRVLIEGNRIAAVDSNTGADRTIDLEGRLAVPGFIDNHVHFVDGGLQLSRVRLRDARTPRELAERIATHPVSGWVLGGEWDEQLWGGDPMPSRQMIDIDAPVFVTRLDMHMALANTKALQLAGVTRETPDPPGGTIVRDADGEPTGLVKDAAMALVSRVIPPPSLGERIAAARAGLAEAAKYGVTSFCDMGMTDAAWDDLRAYQHLDREDGLTARVYHFMPIRDYARLRDAGIEKRFGSRLRIGGLKGFSDGSLGSSTAAFFEPYENDRCNCGLVMEAMASGEMAKWVADADAHDLQIALHAIGDRANADVLSLLEAIPNARERRFRVEHAQHLNPELIARFGRSGIIASMQPRHAVDDGRWADKKIGSARAQYAYAFRSLLDAGAIVTFGSDWNVVPLDPIIGIAAAVARDWVPEQRITVEEALRCYTVNNAYATFAERETGRIAPGLFADIAVLSEDLFAISAEDIEGVRVDMTIFDGRIVFNRR